MNRSNYNADDFVREFLFRHDNDAEALFKASKEQESCWMELKADPFCLQSKEAKEGDRRLHTIKAVMALVNTRGGCVLFNVDDTTHAPVETVRYRDGSVVGDDRDRYHRQIDDFLFKNRRFEKSDGTFSYDFDLKSRCEFAKAVYRGRTVSALIVRPSEGRNYCVARVDGRELVYVRAPGDMGKSFEMPLTDLLKRERPPLPFDSARSGKCFDNMPAPSVDFQGRKRELEALKECHLADDPWRIPLLFGAAGIGKTEIAYKYVSVCRDAFDTIVLVRAGDCGSLPEAMARIAADPEFRRVCLPGTSRRDADGLETEELFERIRIRISSGELGRVLFVLDDVRHSDVLRSSIVLHYFPEEARRHLRLLATSRYPCLNFPPGDSVLLIEVSPLSSVESLALLERKRPFPNEREKNFASRIADILGWNPWALDLVGEILRQIIRPSDSDYESMFFELDGSRKAFPPVRPAERSRIGNVTGILSLKSLYESTATSLGPEELDICRILSLEEGNPAEENALRKAFEFKYGRPLEDGEWNVFVDSLQSKGVLDSPNGGFYEREFRFRDALFRRWLDGQEKDGLLLESFLEYIRARVRSGTCPKERTFRFWKFVSEGNFPAKAKIDLFFDEERFGWPLGLMGFATVKWILSQPPPGETRPLLWSDIEAVCSMAESFPEREADVMEIRGLASEDGKDAVVAFGECTLGALRIRERLYADRPEMLAKSYYHVAEMANGILPARVSLQYLSRAISIREQDPSRVSPGLSAKFYDLRAYLEEVRIQALPENRFRTIKQKARNRIRSWLETVLELQPDFYGAEDDETLASNMENGVYPLFD